MRYGNGSSNVEIGRARYHHDGVITELGEIRIGVGGQNVVVFKSSVEWTYAVTTESSYFEFNYYGNSDHVSSQISGGGTMDTIDGSAYCHVVYTFKDPLVLKTGQTVEIQSGTGARGHTEVDINDNFIHEFGIHDSNETYIYTLPNDLTVATITATTHASNSIHNTSSAYLKVIIHADIGSFLLNDSGTSYGQT